jgi:hypothetical protein
MKILLILCSFILGATILSGDKPTISASLSESTTEVDQPVQLTLTVENARVSHPPTVATEGLAISFAGTSTQTQIINSKVSSKTIFTYIVTPTKDGTFTIPPIPISVGNDTYKTAPLTLNVSRSDDSRRNNGDDLYFGELVIPKESAYVGEQIPIELRFYFDRRINFESYPQGQLPLIDGEGFVTKKYTDPVDRQLSVNGRMYQAQVYKTAISGAKPGKLELGSANQQFRIVFGFGSGGNQGFNAPFQNFQEQVVTVKTNGASIDIKPLPTAGRPQNFSGAIGDFTLSASALPSTTKIGDPIVMKVEIKGLGNFDRMDPPTLSKRDSWRIYDPTNEMNPLDDIGLSGTKTFNFPIIPEKQLTALPTAEFSYFDPNAEKYVTLNSAPVPVTVEEARAQQAASSAPPASLAPSGSPPIGAASSGNAAHMTAETAEPDILDIRRDSANGAPAEFSFQPFVDTPRFWIAQAVPAILLISFAIAALGFEAHQPRQKLLREQRIQEQKLNIATQSDALLNATVSLLELHLRLSRINRRSPKRLAPSQGTYLIPRTSTLTIENLDVQSALSDPDLPESVRLDVEIILQKRADLAYGGAEPESVTQEERTKTKELVARWRTAL